MDYHIPTLFLVALFNPFELPLLSLRDCLQAQKQVQEDGQFQLGYHLGVKHLTRIVPVTNMQELEQGKT